MPPMTRDETITQKGKELFDGKVQNENRNLQQGVRLSSSGKKLEQREKRRIPRPKTLSD